MSKDKQAILTPNSCDMKIYNVQSDLVAEFCQRLSLLNFQSNNMTSVYESINKTHEKRGIAGDVSPVAQNTLRWPLFERLLS
jgi:hypothetical protein